MNIKPSGQQVEKWIAEASSEGGKILDPNKLAELAAQWGAAQAQQTTGEEPELPEPFAYTYQNRYTDQQYLTWSKSEGGKSWVSLFTAAQMHDHFAAGVRSGMGQSQWQPIETAPKDGRSFDVWVKSTKNPDYGVRMTGVYYVQGVLCGSRFPNSSWCEYASHWMPLPTPPAMQGDNHE